MLPIMIITTVRFILPSLFMIYADAVLVSHLFAQSWSHPRTVKVRPKICAIYEIRLELTSLFAYHGYRCQIQATSSAFHPARSTGNEMLLFHGTDRLCAIGEQRKNLIPCSSLSCRLCCIIRGSFDLHKCRSKHSFSRFGQGIYTTSCSSSKLIRCLDLG
jgi:hypothetical protein